MSTQHCEDCKELADELVDCASCDKWVCKNCQFSIEDHYDVIYCEGCAKCHLCKKTDDLARCDCCNKNFCGSDESCGLTEELGVAICNKCLSN